ncbi:MAG: hypothetical protein Q8L60_17025 [Gammaproteobacteria bacterium]|nr:hypothetical protein [Gammaproteobacteria bacterium]MDP2139379.1 hypothetical protein [Gammaproteobacteria bacterium]MDP2346215.1 hypothetical protein [Gammaproteobacteria bacterium]
METPHSKPCLVSRKRVTLVTSFIFLLLPVVVLADVCSYEKTVAFSVPMENIKQLEIEARAGW